MPCFNQSRFLTACLESVRSQTFEDWEAIVVDDASTEGDVEGVVRAFGDRRVRIIRHEINRGAGASRNTGFCDAQADLILPLDCDDGLRARFLATTLAPFHDSASVDCVFTDFQLFGDADEVWTNSATRPIEEILVRQWIPGAGTLMRTEVWVRAGGYCEDRALLGNEDWDFWISALEAGVKPVHVAGPLYLYRQHAASTSFYSRQIREYQQRELMYGRHREFFDRYQAGETFRALGYVNSVAFALKAKERRHALAIVWLGLRRVGLAFVQNLARVGLHRWTERRDARRDQSASPAV